MEYLGVKVWCVLSTFFTRKEYVKHATSVGNVHRLLRVLNQKTIPTIVKEADQ